MNNYNKITVFMVMLLAMNISVAGVSDKRPNQDTNSDTSKVTIVSTVAATASFLTSSSTHHILKLSSISGLVGISSSLYAIYIADMETDTGKIFIGWNSITALASFISFIRAVQNMDSI